jgi:hypothetical protein
MRGLSVDEVYDACRALLAVLHYPQNCHTREDQRP